MEKELFNFESYDIIDEGVYQFYNVTLVKDIGQFPIGTKFKCAVLSFVEGTLVLFDEQHKFNLHLQVE